jgi:hypothetical protein
MSPDEETPMAQAVKILLDPIIGNYDVLAYKKDESGKITGYVVDLSTTFDADVQTFSLDPIKKQLLNIQTFQKINHSFQK